MGMQVLTCSYMTVLFWLVISTNVVISTGLDMGVPHQDKCLSAISWSSAEAHSVRAVEPHLQVRVHSRGGVQVHKCQLAVLSTLLTPQEFVTSKQASASVGSSLDSSAMSCVLQREASGEPGIVHNMGVLAQESWRCCNRPSPSQNGRGCSCPFLS